MLLPGLALLLGTAVARGSMHIVATDSYGFRIAYHHVCYGFRIAK